MIKALLTTLALEATDVNVPRVSADDSALQIVLRFVFGIMTLVAVIYLIITGLKLITQQGDPVGLSKARQAIIYTLLGLIILLFADAIVFFVIGRL